MVVVDMMGRFRLVVALASETNQLSFVSRYQKHRPWACVQTEFQNRLG